MAGDSWSLASSLFLSCILLCVVILDGSKVPYVHWIYVTSRVGELWFIENRQVVIHTPQYMVQYQVALVQMNCIPDCWRYAHLKVPTR